MTHRAIREEGPLGPYRKVGTFGFIVAYKVAFCNNSGSPGFQFEMHHLCFKHLGRCSPAQSFTRSIIKQTDSLIKLGLIQ